MAKSSAYYGNAVSRCAPFCAVSAILSAFVIPELSFDETE